MKKVTVILLMLMMICGCSGFDVPLPDSNTEVADFPDDLVEFAEGLILTDHECSIGTGVYANGYRNGTLERSESCVFPYYVDGQISGLILRDDNGFEFSDEYDSVTEIEKRTDGNYELILVNKNLYLVDSEDIILIYGDKDIELTESESGLMRRVQKIRIRTNRLGAKRRRLEGIMDDNTVIGPDGKLYSSSRIVVRFTPDDIEAKKQMFADFCHGTLRSGIRSQNIYVFTVARGTYSSLMEIVKEAEKLEYVDSCWLDEVKTPNESSSNAVKNEDK